MMLDRKWMRRAAIVVFAIMLAGFWIVAIEALRGGRIWIGAGYRGVPLDTVGILIVLVPVTILGGIQAVRYWR